jgi:hypothetical protein
VRKEFPMQSIDFVPVATNDRDYSSETASRLHFEDEHR